MRILVVDVGGTHVKMLAMDAPPAAGPGEPLPVDLPEPLRLPSGPRLTAADMVTAVREAAAGWDYDVVSVGYPGPVRGGRPAVEPHNLGPGWVGFDFDEAFGHPVRVLNDAAMQALGGYRGGCLLFVGLGTGLGTALVLEGRVQPLELAHLPYRRGRTFEEWVGDAALAKLGKRQWRRCVVDVVTRLHDALQVDEVLVGGGNARHLVKILDELPPGTRLGSNADALAGGARLWSLWAGVGSGPGAPTAWGGAGAPAAAYAPPD